MMQPRLFVIYVHWVFSPARKLTFSYYALTKMKRRVGSGTALPYIFGAADGFHLRPWLWPLPLRMYYCLTSFSPSAVINLNETSRFGLELVGLA